MAEGQSETDDSFQRFKKQGIEMELKGDKLVLYIQQCLDREERMMEREKQERRETAQREAQEKREAAEREAQEKREAAEREAQREIKLKEMELEQERLKSGLVKPEHSDKSGKTSAKINFPKLPMFNEEKDDIDSYLFRFEAHAKAVNWKESDWPIIMGTLLQGTALALYHSLCAAGSLSYNVLKQALLTKFQCSQEGFRERFRSCRPEQEESFPSFFTRLKHLFQRWTDMAGVEKDFHRLVDLILSEQILTSVSKELSVFLRERALKTAKEIVDTAECFRMAHPGKNLAKSSNTGFVAFSQNSPAGGQHDQNRGSWRGRGQTRGFGRGQNFNRSQNQDFQENTQDRNQQPGRGGFRGRGARTGQRGSSSSSGATLNCHNCGGKGHWSTQCVSETVTCTFCKRRGHLVDFCRDRQKAHLAVGQDVDPASASVGLTVDASQSEILCSVKNSHANLPISKGVVNGVQISVLRDSGATIAGVRKALVHPHQYLGTDQEVISFGGQIQTFPLAEVDVQTSFYAGPLVCCVIQEPVVDLILGNVKGVSPIPGLIVGDDRAVMASVVTRAQSQKDKQTPQKLPVHVLPEDFSVQQLKQWQKDDKTIAQFYNLAQQSQTDAQQSQYSFVFCEGVLTRQFLKKGEEIVQIVVPLKARQIVLSTAHDGLLSGHCGVRKTLIRVQNRFWWPGVTRDVRQFIQTCDTCQKVFPKGRVPDIPLSQMPMIEQPFQRVAIDIVGPITPMSAEKHRYILTVIDVSTRFPEAIPMKSIDSVSVAEALFSVFSRLGFPAELLSDNGSQFTSDMFKEFLRLLQIKQIHSSPYHAQSNGLVERFHGTLKPMLKKTVQNHPQLWHRYLPALLFACREMVNDSTGFSPFELLFGRKPRGPIDFLADSWIDANPNSQAKTTTQHVFELRNTINEMSKLAQSSVEQARKTQKHYHDKKSRQRTFQVGDEVLVLLPSSANKLLMSWKGPFKIVQCLDFDYLLEMNGKTRIFHPNMLKKYFRRENQISSSATLHTEETDIPLQEILSPDFPLSSNSEEDQSCSEVSPPVAFVGILPDSSDEFDGDESVPEIHTLSSGESFRDVHFDDNLSSHQRQQLSEVFSEFQHILTSNPGKFSLGVEHEINLSTEKPVFSRRYSLPFQALQTIKDEVQFMLDLKVIEPSRSPYSAPVVLVKKPDGSTRFCCDYRLLNKVTVPDAEPIPDHDALFAQVAQSKFFTKIDLSKGYWQIVVKESDRPKTAFQTDVGLFQWIRMPFGLATAPATFARAMRALQLGPHAINFFDDILIHSKSWSEHLLHVRDVLSKLKAAGFTARPSKIFAGFKELLFLGHVLGEGTLRPETKKVEKILQIPTPTTKRQVRALLGLVGYYRRYIPDCATILQPISDLLGGQAGRQISWTPVCQEALEKIQSLLSQKPVLRLPDFTRRFIVRTDASSVGIGGVLMQEHNDQLHPVAFVSRKLLSRESRYSTIERECLSIIWVLSKFSRYLWGRIFTLQTDHRPLTYLQSSRFRNARILRWSLALQEFSFSVLPIAGTFNVFADLLSRTAVSQSLP